MDPLLIVDDEKDNLEALQRLLRNQFAVTVTTSPFDALKLVQQQAFHVIVSDQRMPEMSGVELLEKVKNVSPTTTRVLLTGYTDIDSVIGAINRGQIYRYIAKPWDPDDLKITLRQANEAFLLRRELEIKNANLQKALDDLRSLDRAKARFLSLISHELNTPLTVLTSFIELLTEKEATFPDDIRKAVSRLRGASGRFGEIVAEVLTYTRLESDSQWKLAPFDLEREMATVKGALEKDYAKKKLRITIRRDGDLPLPSCDPEKMRVGIVKLLTDACERSPQGGEVRVTLKKDRDRANGTVWRQGETLSEDAFKPLEADGEEKHHHRNLGLALAIFRLIVEGHGGEVRLESSSAEGTTIAFGLPLDKR